MINGIFTVVLMLLFFAIIAWAWSDRRKEEFEHLANLPLEDGENINDGGDNNGNE